MAGRDNTQNGSDKSGDNSEGISWTTYKRSPGESKNGNFLCRNCGFEIFQTSLIIDTELYSGEYIEALNQGNTKLGKKVKSFSTVAVYLNCKKCEKTVGYISELKGRDKDNVTTKFLFKGKELVFEKESLSCKSCRCVVDKGDSSNTLTFKWHYSPLEIVLIPIQNKYGTFYNVKAFFEVCKEYFQDCYDENMFDILCVQCNAPIGLNIVSTEEKEEPFVGFILDNLSHDDAVEEITDRCAVIQLGNKLKGNIYKDRSVAETSVVNDKMAKKRPRSTRYSSRGLIRKITQNTEERNESPTLQVNSNTCMAHTVADKSIENGNMTKEKPSSTCSSYCDILLERMQITFGTLPEWPTLGGNNYKAPSVAETSVGKDNIAKKRPRSRRYLSRRLIVKKTQNKEERNESPTLQVNS